MNYKKIGEFIAQKRKEKKLTQKELASILKVTDKAVSKWERGLGCPDVSILELLAKTLDVSILEILKGRKIENEVIKVTEANDYVKETIEYSKKERNQVIKNITLNIITIIIVLIVAILAFLNISHIIYLNQTENYNFDSEISNKIKENKEEVFKNINVIRTNKSKFNKEDKNEIENYLKELENQYNNMDIINYKGNHKYNLKDLFVFDLKYPSVMQNIKIYNILIKYDETITNSMKVYEATFLAKGFLGMNVMEEPNLMYKYNLPYNDLNLSGNTRIEKRMFNYYYLTTHDVYLTNLILEVGGINE